MSSGPLLIPPPHWLERLALAGERGRLGAGMGDSVLLRVLRRLTDWFYDRFRGWIQGSVVARNAETLSIFAVCLLFLASPFVGTAINAALVLLAFGMVLVRLLAQPDTRAEFSTLDGLVLGFIAVHVIATGFSPNLVASAKGLAKMVVYWLAYFSFRQVLQSRRALFAVLAALFLAGTLEAAYGVFQWKIGVEPLANWEDPETLDPLTRVYSTLMNPNLLAGYLLPIFPLALTAAARWRMPFRLLPAAGLAVVPLCIYFTYCRSAYVAVVFVLVIFGGMGAWLIRDRLRQSRQLMGGLVLGVVGVLALAALRIATSPSLQTRLLSIFTLRGHSSNSFRVNVWEGVLRMVHDNWLIGVGVGNTAFRKVYSLYMVSGFEALGAYNIWLEVLAEMGVVGLFLFSWLLVAYLARNAWTYWLGQGESRWWAVAVLAALVGMGVMGMVDTVFYRPAVQLQFWLLLAMTIAISPSRRDPVK
ncbi:MAG: inorganic carbon transporter [Cyanobacteria bacterium RYN_339]|nr:inorganic carbon transporter [Cyanobacteria bacterium RYN_339]